LNQTNLQSTAILDYRHPTVESVSASLASSSPSDRAFLQLAHGYIAKVMRAVYSIEETMPVSRLFQLNQGSCSQRMACLEALARSRGIATRVRALWLDRTFWFSRLPLLRLFLPKKGILMPWPQFWIADAWLDFDEIYGPVAELAARATHPFTNRGESMFDAVQHVPVDFFGKSEQAGCPAFSLAPVVVGDDGYFDLRDELLSALDKRSWIGRLIFKLTYENKPVRRLPE
jgi:Transglutaminase-like superfamily